MAIEPHRDFCRRQHRMLALHLSLEAWRTGVDCLLLERLHLEEFLNLQRFKSTRIQWLLEDVRPWFAHPYPIHTEGALDSLQRLYLSRIPLERRFLIQDADVEAEDFLPWLREQGLRIGLLRALQPDGPLTEEFLVTRFALLASGLVEP
jgi:hypothetical protein